MDNVCDFLIVLAGLPPTHNADEVYEAFLAGLSKALKTEPYSDAVVFQAGYLHEDAQTGGWAFNLRFFFLLVPAKYGTMTHNLVYRLCDQYSAQAYTYFSVSQPVDDDF
jgi:hypothetical protein